MFGPAGHAYVYATQGRCCCVNVTVEGGAHGRAVLLRAAEPEVGVGVMRRRRLARLADGPTRRVLLSGADNELARGPGRLCLCFDVDTSLDGVDLTDPSAPLGLADVAGESSRPSLLWTGRIGLNPASASHDWRWRAIDRDARSVSPDRALRQSASARPVPPRPPGTSAARHGRA
jgi:DNA-3-methyladenine glycosylase